MILGRFCSPPLSTILFKNDATCLEIQSSFIKYQKFKKKKLKILIKKKRPFLMYMYASLQKKILNLVSNTYILYAWHVSNHVLTLFWCVMDFEKKNQTRVFASAGKKINYIRSRKVNSNWLFDIRKIYLSPEYQSAMKHIFLRQVERVDRLNEI